MVTDNSEPKPRFFHPTPGKLLAVLLAVEGILFLVNWFRWMPKGWAVLIAMTAVGVFLIGMLLWFVLALLFRERFQFSIRWLLMMTVAVAVPCSWLAFEMQKAREQRKAVEAIGPNAGREATFNFKKFTDDPFADEPPLGPEWIVKLVGEQFFHDVTSVMFSDRKITDEMLINLKAFPRLRSLAFMECDLSDGELQAISDIKHLKELSLFDTSATDNGLRHLQALPELESLCISYATLSGVVPPSALSDQGLMYLTELRHLKSLRLTNTRVTDEGVRRLQQVLPNCKIECTITNTSFKQSTL